MTTASPTDMGTGLPVIEVKNLTKEYRLGALESLRSSIRRMLGRPMEERQRFKALDDVSFTVGRGEVVGIIGHNGAGKSTLLKHLCNITTPTTGTVAVRGRVAPLIEVGAGLIGDMTGRENIYLNATILGLSRAEIEAKIDEIIEFSELGQFIDTPVKRYSSGMQVRLGFAIATTVDSAILIVDEVLAVGDLSFQRKCLDRMESIINNSEQTVIVVGHNIRQLERVCSRMVLLDHGRVLMDGCSSEVANKYYELNEEQRAAAISKPSQSTEGSGVELLNLTLFDGSGVRELSRIEIHESLKIRMLLKADIPYPDVDVAIGLHTVDFLHVLTFNTAPTPIIVDLQVGTKLVECDLPDVPLMPGIYGIRVGISDKFGRPIWYKENIKMLTVGAGGLSRSQMSLQCLIDLPVAWSFSD